MQFRPNPCTPEDGWLYGDQADALCRAWYPTRGGILYPPYAQVSGAPAGLRGLGAVPASLALIAIAGTPDGLGATPKKPVSYASGLGMGAGIGFAAANLAGLVYSFATGAEGGSEEQQLGHLVKYGALGAFVGGVVGLAIVRMAKKRGIETG